MDFSEALEEFTIDCRIRKLSKRTIRNYRVLLKLFQRSLAEQGITQLEDIRPSHMKQFMLAKEEAGRKPRYINDLLKVARTLFLFACREGFIQNNPVANIRNMRQPKLKLRTFSEAEIRRLLNHFNGNDFLNCRNKTILALFFDTGMRLSEVLNLTEEQIHEEYIIVFGKGSKERLVPVSPYLAQLLIRYRRIKEKYFRDKLPPKPFVFVSYKGNRLTPEAVTKFMKSAAKAVNVSPEIRVSPHTCRHTFAHLQLRNGLDLYSLSRLMGHENIAITQRYLEGIRDDEVLEKAKETGVLAHL
ncbi:MAG: tyrosine-type recombinase/integrase [Spirochaetales bacterium]|nr:tyrosine-type recombinase/integrase [Spirochaetales bacterium]